MKVKRLYFSPLLEARLSSADKINEVMHRSSAVAPTLVSFVNPFSYPIVAADAALVKAVDFWFCDGAWMCLLTNFFRHPKIRRASFDFSSIATSVFREAERKNLRLAVVGGTDIDLRSALIYLRIRYPGSQIVFESNGFFSEAEAPAVLRAIGASRPDILIIGMGTPKQEIFGLQCKPHLPRRSLIFTCGAFISQTAQRGDYYPWIVKKLRIRWVQRAMTEKHVRRRLMRWYPVFSIRYPILAFRYYALKKKRL